MILIFAKFIMFKTLNYCLVSVEKIIFSFSSNNQRFFTAKLILVFSGQQSY